jgi:uncharacterized membrane protein
MSAETATFEIGKNRVEALSDGIFAIVMTLLILELHVPKLPATAANVEVTAALFDLWPKFVSYLVAFISLGVFWIAHHIMYHAVRRADRTLLWLNIVFFMFVSVMPFSTSLLNSFPAALIAPFLLAPISRWSAGCSLCSGNTSGSSPACSQRSLRKRIAPPLDAACSRCQSQRP